MELDGEDLSLRKETRSMNHKNAQHGTNSKGCNQDEGGKECVTHSVHPSLLYMGLYVSQSINDNNFYSRKRFQWVRDRQKWAS